MNYLLVALSLLLAGCSLRPSDSSWVTHHLGNDTPLVFKDPNVLRTGLDLESRPAIRGGEVWKVAVSSSGAGVQTHWLILYPDGRLVTSLDDDPERTKVNFMTADVEQRELARQRARLNDERLALLTGRDPDALFAMMKSGHAQRTFRVPQTIGQWDLHDEVIRLNIIETYRIEGELPGPWWYERTGVSQLVFRKKGAIWAMSQQESRPVWFPPSAWESRITQGDHPCLHSLRDAEVSAVKVDNFVPRPLPDHWKW
jgi:hypothetical protein